MAIIVDGNNVMGQTPGWHRDKPGARLRLLGEVAAFVAVTRTRATVVFDGGPEDGIRDGSVFKGVKVYFPPRGADADSLIERLLGSARDRRGITVVTSDRRLALECRAAGARVMASGEFRKKMVTVGRDRIASDPVAGDPGAAEAVSGGSVDDWMRFFGLDPDDDSR